MTLLARRRRKVEINIVPLMDVLTILIFFFLVSMQFREIKTLNLTLPEVETAGKNEFVSPMVIAIDGEGSLYVNGTPASDEILVELVKMVSSQSTNITVLIKADEETPLNRVTLVMDTCRKVGLNKIRLQSR
ncbi:MAG: biopolymer transporter ExbD [Opitutaceae bacterium]|nr:biopolymer transporter ExbD [Opitutaceae bacterium]